MATEEPKFTLALKEGAFELRDYPALIVAEVTVTGDQQQASRAGFRKLAGYIFGGNSGAKRIAMTAPVTAARTGQNIAMTVPVTQIGASGEWVVRFTMPATFTLADLPTPNDPTVSLQSLPATRYAVTRFSGLAGEAKVAAETAGLLSTARTHNLSLTGPVSLARYNPPWTPWFLRRNEVMVPVGVAV